MLNKIFEGNCLPILKTLPSKSVHCCITSPPYYGLRDYQHKEQIGQEKTIKEYIDNLILVFNQVKRMLKSTGTLWVVIGDSYAGTGDKNGARDKKSRARTIDKYVTRQVDGIPDKSMLLIPQRFVVAMLDNGWIVRNEIIWQKSNVMTSSAKDRYTVDYEHIFFFSKANRYYFKTQYEPYAESTIKEALETYKGKGIKDYEGNNVQNPSDVKRRIIAGLKTNIRFGGNKRAGGDNPTYSGKEWVMSENGRIARTVWKINTQGCGFEHFAAFPEELVRRCINAGCPEAICNRCNRMKVKPIENYTHSGIVLDPFFGKGTTGLVALKMNRNFIGIELNKDYIDIANFILKPLL